MRYRLIKPDWGIQVYPNGKQNPSFVREIRGSKIYEGDNHDSSYLKSLNENGYNIYYFPNGTSQHLNSGEWLKGSQIDKFDWLFVDMDLKDGSYASKEDFINEVKKFPLNPTWGMDSGNGVHIYWKIQGINRLQFMELQLRLIAHFNTDASIWTPLQLMRLPGYKNTKDPNNFKQTKTLGDFPMPTELIGYSYFDFNKHLAPVTAEAKVKIDEHNDKLEGRTSIVIGPDLDDLPKKFEKLLEKNQYINNLFYDPEGTKGDRSAADMSLANLLFTLDFDRDEAIRVLYNSQKARSRSGDSRYQYAINTVINAYSTNTKSMAVPNLSYYRKNKDAMAPRGELVRGPYFLDTKALAGGWRKGQMLGLIGGSGTGKTSLSLKIFKELITNNPKSDDIYFLVGIEMNASEYYDNWRKLVGDNEEHYNRLYIIEENFFEDNDITPTVQNIYKIIRDTSRTVGKPIGAVCLDHLHILACEFDSSVEPLFGADSSQHVLMDNSNRGTRFKLTLDGLCEVLKRFCRKLDCFLILQSQTTKEKDDGGDIPIGKNACFGTSKFEWYCDYVIGIWQPLKRAQNDCKASNLFVTAFQYNKIRHQDAQNDRVSIGTHYITKFLPGTQDYVSLSSEDMDKFFEIQETAIKMREAEKNKRSKAYYRAPLDITPGRSSSEKVD